MLIEFIGLPGSGKTTYLKSKIGAKILTREQIENRKIPMITRFSFYLKEWRLISLFTIGILYNFDFKIKKWYALIIGVQATLRQYSFVYYCKKKKHGLSIILDEGLFQRSLSVFSFNDRKYNIYLLKKISKKINSLNIIDSVYCFDLTVEESLSRSEKREDGLPFRFQNLKKLELNNKFYIFQRGLIILKECIKAEIKIIK